MVGSGISSFPQVGEENSMQMRLLTVGFVLVLVLGLWNAWSMHSLNSRLSAMDGQSNVAATAMAGSEDVISSVRAERSVANPVAAASGVQAGNDLEGSTQTIDLENPEVREAIAQIVEEGEVHRKTNRRKERVGMYLDSMTREIETFAEEFDLDPATRDKVIREVETRTQAYVAVKNDVKDGELSWFDAKEEFRAIRDEGETNLRGILGDDQFEELSGRLWGGGGHGK